MREATIARNYAEALFAAGERSGQTERLGELLDAVAGAIQADARIQAVLASPRVPKAVKERLLARALAGRAPETLVRFLGAVVRRGRQGLLPAIAEQYQTLLDRKLDRVHAGVVLARPADGALLGEIAQRLRAAVGREVVLHPRQDPRILGGIVVRIGDRVMDGSVRRKMLQLRRYMLGG